MNPKQNDPHYDQGLHEGGQHDGRSRADVAASTVAATGGSSRIKRSLIAVASGMASTGIFTNRMGWDR